VDRAEDVDQALAVSEGGPEEDGEQDRVGERDHGDRVEAAKGDPALGGVVVEGSEVEGQGTGNLDHR
jgi:hypothetical protein